MAVPIDENILMFVVGALFIPMFGFCLKLIIEMSANRSRFKEFDAHMEEAKGWKKEINDLQNAKNILELRLMGIERSLETHGRDLQDLSRHRYFQSPIKGGEPEERHE